LKQSENYKKIIGVKNPRNQRLKDLDIEKKIFIDFYNYIFNALKNDKDHVIDRLELDNISNEYISLLAANTNAMSQDGLKFSEIKVVNNSSDSLWVDYGNFVKEISSNTDAKKYEDFVA
jgi:hypothetical protein